MGILKYRQMYIVNLSSHFIVLVNLFWLKNVTRSTTSLRVNSNMRQENINHAKLTLLCKYTLVVKHLRLFNLLWSNEGNYDFVNIIIMTPCFIV